jgi:hypothetical protein
MLGKVIGAVAGRRVAKSIGGINGPAGAILGVGAAALMRRMGPAGMVTATVGGWALKRYLDKHPPAGRDAVTSPVR